MINIAPYIAKYVRSLHSVRDPLEIPYIQTQFGVVLMVDVVGFSRLTTLATEKGASGAEAIALEIGAYLGECIQIVEFYGGDVVKFLGDAVLVSFQAPPSEPGKSDHDMDGKEASLRQKSILVRRALECGQQLLARLSHYRVYLTAEERAKHRTATGDIDRQSKHTQKGQRFFLFDGQDSSSSSNNENKYAPSLSPSQVSRDPDSMSIDEYPEEYTMAFGFWSCFPLLRRKAKDNRIYIRHSSQSAEPLKRNKDVVDLELHIAMSCGNISNIIIGEMNPKHRTSHASSLSTNSNSRKSKRFSTLSNEEMDIIDQYFVEYTGRLEYAICGPAVELLEDALSAAKAGEMSITGEVYRLAQNQRLSIGFEKRNRFYIVHSKETDDHHHHNRRGVPPSVNSMRYHMGVANANTGYLANLPVELKRQASQLNVEPLVPRARNPEYMDMYDNNNPVYYKYINRSTLYRLQHSPDSNFPAQFRDVTIMFVSFGKLNVATTTGLAIVQKAFVCAIDILVKYEGMVQQFAVDDKGPTLLAVFGLPPLSHEREAVFAAKAAVELRDAYRKLDLPDFAIALSTGMIFNAVLPPRNPYRRDPSICGDTIVMAVRMLKFPFASKNVVCDASTKHQIRGLCDFEDKGQNFVKGKIKPIQIYSIERFGHGGRPKRISLQEKEEDSHTDFIGYSSEMARATRFIADWNEAQNHHVLVISGPSGVGKSFFCHALNRKITATEDVFSCWASSTEVEKGSKYYLIKNLLISLFELIDSDKIPQNTKQHSIGNHLPNTPLIAPSRAGDRTSTASQLSALSNRESLRRLESYSSHHASSPHLTDFSNELTELITRCLAKCGEDESLLPLFKSAFTTLGEVRENKYTSRLDGRARDILLAGVISRMIRYTCEHVGFVFICDDVQWTDSASIRALKHIHEQCQRFLLIMATRTIRDYNLTFLNDFAKVGSYEEIALNGLGADEIGEIIVQAFQSGVKRVSPEIVRVFQKRTGGNPLFVKNMAIVLKDFNSDVSVMDGELVTTSSEFDLEDLLVNFDYKRIIKMQFDRLDANFQEFLTAASCLDQYFTIQEVAAIVDTAKNAIFRDSDIADIPSRIRAYDTYRFLQQVDSPTLHDSGLIVYTFAHITIPESIYAMVPYESRVEQHQRLAKYYEAQLNRDNFSDLLSKVTRHYMKTDALGKQLYYLERLADVNIRSYFLPEATDNLKAIVKILCDNQDIAARFGRIHQSDIYRRLGMCYTMRTKLNEGEQYLFLSLDVLGEPWPRSELEFFYKLWMNRVIQHQHRRWGTLQKYKNSRKRAVWRRVVEMMVQLSNIYFYKGKGRAFVYTCLIGLNACERLGETGSIYTFFLARNALICWINDQKDHSIFYITQAIRHMDEKHDAGTLTICSMLCFAAGKFSNASELLYQSIEAVKTLGVITDCQSFYRSVGLVITMRIFEGTLNNSTSDLLLLKQMADTAHANGDSEAEIWLGVYNVGNAIVMDRLNDCEAHVALLEAHIIHAADYNKIAIHGTLLCYYARESKFTYAQEHVRHLVNILPSLTVTPNIFPIFGLIFATMGLYRMIEEDEGDLITDDDGGYDQFNLGVARINHAFQQVKFWEFTQPCLYLARALPYISTGRTVEGYLVLRHGIYEMHFIQEISFLKAYYWANLGKYAFTPNDRIDWTERARVDLDALSIPSHVYCNPDPANCYSRSKKADLRA